MRTCTRRLEWDAAHRVTKHGGRCENLHGHRYIAEIHVGAPTLDDKGFVFDFGQIKEVVGSWIDDMWDHGSILYEKDHELIHLCHAKGWKVCKMSSEPTAENIAAHLFRVAGDLLSEYKVSVVRVRVYETPNCWADYSGEVGVPDEGII